MTLSVRVGLLSFVFILCTCDTASDPKATLTNAGNFSKEAQLSDVDWEHIVFTHPAICEVVVTPAAGFLIEFDNSLLEVPEGTSRYSIIGYQRAISLKGKLAGQRATVIWREFGGSPERLRHEQR